jgi:hypothetical protein
MPAGDFTMMIGSRAQVWHGTAKKTSGGLEKKDLMMNKRGRIVSRAKAKTAKKEKLSRFGDKRAKPFGSPKTKKTRKASKK